MVVWRPGAEPLGVAELGAFLTAAGLARFKHPEHVVSVDALPRAASAKLDKAAIRRTARQVLDV